MTPRQLVMLIANMYIAAALISHSWGAIILAIMWLSILVFSKRDE